MLAKIGKNYFFISRHYSTSDVLMRKNALSHQASFVEDVSFINKRAALKLYIK
jgi:hypothetical protein